MALLGSVIERSRFRRAPSPKQTARPGRRVAVETGQKGLCVKVSKENTLEQRHAAHEGGNVGVRSVHDRRCSGQEIGSPLTGRPRNGPGASNRGDERSQEREHLLLAGLEPDERCSKRDNEHQRWVRSRSRLVQLAKRDGSARFKRGLEALAVGRKTSADRIVHRRSVH